MTNTPTIAASLSDAQKALLAQLPCSAASTYRPAKKLVELGLATRRVGRYGGTYFDPTELGEQVRHLLKEGESEGSDGR